MKTILFLLICCSTLLASAQVNPTTDPNKYNDPQNMDVVYQTEAKFPAGEKELYGLIYSSISYTEEALAAEIRKDLVISFDVNFDSTLTSFVVIQSIGFSIDEQVIETLKKLKFAPAIMNGIAVRQNVMLTIPIVTSPLMDK